MVKRPRQHQIEDLSRTRFNSVLPRNWVYRDKTKDYGIDGEIEIFDENDEATGFVFLIQLKATISKKEIDSRKAKLKVDTIRYYYKLELPVLIVRYSESYDSIYFKWAHSIDIYEKNSNTKTMTVNFSETDKWKSNSPAEIENYLRKIKNIKDGFFKFPIPTSTIIKDSVINKFPRGILMSSFHTVLHKFPEFVLLESNSNKSMLHILFTSDKLVINLSSIFTCTFPDIKKYDRENFFRIVAINSFIGLAYGLSRIGQFEKMTHLLLDIRIRESVLLDERHLIYFLPIMLSTSYFDEVLDAISDTTIDEANNMLEILTQALVLKYKNPQDNVQKDKIENFLIKLLNKYIIQEHNSQIGICHYNLGNHYRVFSNYKKSIYHYLIARKYENKYLKQHYYFKELGGSFFKIQKYYYSVIMYEKAIKLIPVSFIIKTDQRQLNLPLVLSLITKQKCIVN
ncbi:MAG: DUF4365 domain-containing protein [Bacteroidetes bacterium]|nr:DUF4365 domain-containing protein [Bacteroidota bacterium]